MKIFKYDNQFWKVMKELNIKTAKRINEVRWDFVKEIKPKIVLDYGAGLDLLRKYAPKEVTVDTFDIGSYPIKYTGIRHKFYDLIFFCDILEHLPDFRVLDDIFDKTEHVFISIPILPPNRSLENCYHLIFDSVVHLHFFTKESLNLFFEARRFKLIKSGYPEVECGIREDIYTALYKKEKGD